MVSASWWLPQVPTVSVSSVLHTGTVTHHYLLAMSVGGCQGQGGICETVMQSGCAPPACLLSHQGFLELGVLSLGLLWGPVLVWVRAEPPLEKTPV